jgi:hypothetical protein
VTSGCTVLVIFQLWTRVSLHVRIIFQNKKTRIGLFLALYNIQLSKLRYFYFLGPRQISRPQKSRNARACTCFWYVVRRSGGHNILKFYGSGTSGSTISRGEVAVLRLIDVRVKYYKARMVKLGKALFIIQKFAN